MAMTVKKRKDSNLPSVIMHRVADIRGGVSVASAELGGDFLPEGAVLSAPENGICHVVKVAVLAADLGASETAVKVKKNSNFKTGDFLAASVGGTAVAVTAVDTASSNSYDTITTGAALGALTSGACLIQAKAAGANAALPYTPMAIVGTGKPVISGVNIDTDAWVIAVTKGAALPAGVAAHLKGIINY